MLSCHVVFVGISLTGIFRTGCGCQNGAAGGKKSGCQAKIALQARRMGKWPLGVAERKIRVAGRQVGQSQDRIRVDRWPLAGDAGWLEVDRGTLEKTVIRRVRASSV